MTMLSLQETWMREILSDPKKIVVPFVAMLLFYKMVHQINITEKERGRQILMPVITLVFCVLAIIGGTAFYEKALWAKTWNIFAKVGNTVLASKGIKPFIHSYLGGAIVYLNIALMSIYIIVKVIAKRFLFKAMENPRRMTLFASRYYEFNDEYLKWLLRTEWRGFQRLMGVLAKISVVLVTIALAFTWSYEVNSQIEFVIFPFVVMLIIEEISNALLGPTKVEFENDIDGSDAMLSGRIGHYQKLMDVYEKLLGNTLITSYRSTEYTPKDGPENYIEELKKSGKQVDQLAAHYFEQQRKERNALDVDYMHGTIELLHGNSVIFANPFYRDMSKYLLLPIVDALIKGYKCLFLVGQRDIAHDTVSWINEMLEDYAKVSGIWRVEQLGRNQQNCEIGIMDFPSLYDVVVQEKNSEFFRNVSVCVLVESSNMIPTAQIGLSLVVNEMNRQQNKPIYCVIDRTSDGLVDTFSHVLQTEITHVIAPPIPRCVFTSAVWDADGDYQRQKWFKKQTRFLGNGVELAAIAIKNQIPKVTWFGGRKAPVRDIEWIAGQYYAQIAEYCHLVRQQSTVQQRLKFEANFWQAKAKGENFLIVEDQYCNMFETLRMFLSRGENQSFVNVISDSYLLRDYMQYNKQLFISDPKAVPSILPDFARTERNVTLYLIMRMVIEAVPEHEIVEELSLIDQDITVAEKSLRNLIQKYTLISDDEVIRTENRLVDSDSPMSDSEKYYFIRPIVYNKYFKNTIKNAYYVTEEAKFDTEYVDAKMYGLLTQCILPGQYLTIDGKYYQAEKVSPEYGVLLSRASDRYTHRATYRQIRRYVFPEDSERFYPVSNRKIMDLEVAKERWNFRVVTEGYLNMRSYHDLKSAQVINYTNDSLYEKLSMEGVDFEHDAPRHPMERAYHNKNVLRIYLPDTDKDMRMTFSMLLQELFKTLYPDNWQYLAVLCNKPDDLSGMLSYMIYDVENFPEYVNNIEEENEDKTSTTEEGKEDSDESQYSNIVPEGVEIKSGDTVYAADIENNLEESATEFSDGTDEKTKEVVSHSLEQFKETMYSDVKQNTKSSNDEENKYTGGNIYIIEDSDIDLGLLESIEHNLMRILEIMDDYLEWHFEQIRVSPTEDPVIKRELSSEEEKTSEKRSKVRLVMSSVAAFFRNLFDKKDSNETEIEKSDNTEKLDTTQLGENHTESATVNNSDEEKSATLDTMEIKIPEWDGYADDSIEKAPEFILDELCEKDTSDEIFVEDGMLDDFEGIEGILELPKTRYRESCFLKFGFDEIDSRVVIEELKGYLTARGCGVTGYEERRKTHGDQVKTHRIVLSNNPLMNARNRSADSFKWFDDDEKEEERLYCDCCGNPLSGVSYEQLSDGRNRCNDCVATAIEDVEQFRRLFNQHSALMQNYYQISFNEPIKVEMTDVRTIARKTGQVFRPTEKMDARVVGYAQRKKNSYNLFIENGSPRLATIDTIVHELTHIWQYINWDDRKLKAIYGTQYKFMRTMIYEGMASWSSIQYLYLIGESSYANLQEQVMKRKLELEILRIIDSIQQNNGVWDMDIHDPYAIGFRLYSEEYSLARNMKSPNKSPFKNDPPLDTRNLVGWILDIVDDYIVKFNK